MVSRGMNDTALAHHQHFVACWLLIRYGAYASVTHRLPFGRSGVQLDQSGLRGDREIETSESCQWSMGGMSWNDEGVEDVRLACSEGDMKGGGERSGESMSF